MYVQKAGEFFKVTNGGAPMNCDNALISIEMEYITAQKNKLEKKMKESFALGKEVELAIAVMRSKRLEYNPQAQSKRAKTKFIPNWTLADLKLMIKWEAPKMDNLPTECRRCEEI